MRLPDTIEKLKNRFKPEAAKNIDAVYLLTVSGPEGGIWLAKINRGQVEFLEPDPGDIPQPDCKISVMAEDLELIMEGKLSAMTAALSGMLAIEGELGLAMQLVPIFFDGPGSFI